MDETTKESKVDQKQLAIAYVKRALSHRAGSKISERTICDVAEKVVNAMPKKVSIEDIRKAEEHAY